MISAGGSGGSVAGRAGDARVADRRAQSADFVGRFRQRRALCRAFRHHDALLGHRRCRAQFRVASGSRQRRGRHRRHGAGAAPPTSSASAADDAQRRKPAIGLTMFGVTTPCVQAVIVDALEDDFECLVFHATGVGGQSMEKLVDSGALVGVIDITTTEVCDLLLRRRIAGHRRPVRRHRAHARIPYIGSCGALDMVNFGPMETVPERYRGRTLHVHNPTVTLMRTTPEENARIGRWIGERLNLMDGPVRFFLPEGGVSALDAPGRPFSDPTADEELFRALEATVRQTRLAPAHPHAGAHQRSALFARRSSPSSGGCSATGSSGGGPRVSDMPRVPRSDILARFRAMKAHGEPIIGAGAGTGISAKGEEAGGADLIVIYNSGRYRMAGRGSLAGMMPYRRRQRHRRRNGARGAAGRRPHAGARRRLRHRPVPPDGRLSRRNCAAGLQRRAELPDGRADRRPLSRRSRGDGHGLCAARST